MANLHQRRYSEWLLDMEERLSRRRDNLRRLIIICGFMVAIIEAVFPWSRYTPSIPFWAHILAAAIVLPVLYFMLQNDENNKFAAFNRELGDLGRRLMFLDPTLESEQFEMLEQYHGAILKPTQRAIDKSLKTTGKSKSLRGMLTEFYRTMPSPMHEADRMGILSILHPKTALSWLVALVMIWALFPGVGITIGTSSGLTFLPLLLVLFLVAGHANTRFAYELAMFNWLKLG